jgi:phage protein D
MSPSGSAPTYSARPTIKVDGTARGRASELLVALTMSERDGGMSALELRMTNWASDASGSADFVFQADEAFELGASIEIEAGETGSQQTLFKGKITALEAELSEREAPELVVLAEDAFQQARMTRRSTVHPSATISSLAQAIAGRVGLSASVQGLSANLGTQVQLNESDLAFLRRMLDRNDGDMQVDGSTMEIKPRGDRQRNVIQLAMHRQLRRARVVVDLADQVTKLTVTGWDEVQGQRVSVTSSGVNLGPGSGQKGAELLTQAIGDRAEHVGHLTAPTNAEAQALADAAFDQRARRFVCVEATAEGDPTLRVGTHVELSGLGPKFDNTYVVTGTAHRWGQSRGYETEFAAQCAYWSAS